MLNLPAMARWLDKKLTDNIIDHQPVLVQYSHGVTYAAANAGAFSLNSAISLAMQDAQIDATQIVLREAIGYDAAAKAVSKGVDSFVPATELLVQSMMESAMKRLEIACWYGSKGLCQNKAADTNVNTTTTKFNVSDATWSVGIFAGMKNAKVQFYNGVSLVSSGADSIFTISALDVTNKIITVTGTTTGISALDTASSSTLDMYFNGAKSAEMYGLDYIITNTGSLFNIDASAYELWKGNSYSSGSAALTFGKVLAASASAVLFGLDEKASLFVSPRTWANLNSDLAALRRLDGGWSSEENKNGGKNIKYYAQNGEIEVVSHNIIKEGEAFLIPLKRVKRIGMQELSFKTPGREDEIFLHLPDNAGFELRIYTGQQIFLETPARAVKITNITNT